jgi:hypothetical protein
VTTVWLPYADVDEHLGQLPDSITIDVFDGSTDPPGSIGDVEMYVLPYDFRVEPIELARTMPKLQVMQTLTAGVDNYLPHVPPGVTLCNARGVHDASTAELAVALTLASLRQIPAAVRAQSRGVWEHDRAEALADKSVLIVGYGSVGAAVERRLAGFECEVLRVARTARDGVSGLDALPELLPGARRRRADGPHDRRDPRTRRRGVPRADARRCTARQRRPRPGGGHAGAAGGAAVASPARRARRGRPRAAARGPPGLDRAEPAAHTSRRREHLRLPPRAMRLVGDQIRRYAADEPLANVITGDY